MVKVIIIGMVLMIGVSELHSILGRIWPEEMLKDASDWFIYDQPPNYITAWYWFYEAEGMFKYFMACALAVYLSKRYSRKLYFASLIFLAHSFFTLAMFYVYYKKPAEMFWVVGLLAIGVICCLFVKDKKEGNVVSINIKGPV